MAPPLIAEQPARLTRALAQRRQLEADGVWFAPIRHHSPACARAVKQLVDEVRPAAVLIEGPQQYQALMDALQDPACKPPVAILSLARDGDAPYSSYFPLADFSPEWVALRVAAEHGVPAQFIDLAIGPADVGELAHERYFAHSASLAHLADTLHCRDHDELWEQLFELRPPGNWRQLFDDVFAWSALARLDYEPEVLAEEGSLAREANMAARISEARAKGPLVVVTGAFHTLGLVETLTGGEVPRKPAKRAAPESTGAWLIRYDLTRLDALRGYGAGIPAPGISQRFWDAGPGHEPGVAAECLVDIARAANAAGTTDSISVAEVMAAAVQAQGLADLRGHAWPGRTDILDACASCFTHGESSPALRDALADIFGGNRLGVVPEHTPSPPVVAEVRQTAGRLRFVIADSTKRTTSLDLYRNPSARPRSQFLARLAFLNVGFATRLSGPDFVTGHGLGRLFEEWEYAWTPMVEAALIGLADKGATLAEVVAARLRETADGLAGRGLSRSSSAVVELLAQAIVMGVTGPADGFMAALPGMIEQDPDLASVVGAARRLLGLTRAADALEITEPQRLSHLLARCVPQIAYLVDGLSRVPADGEDAAVATLVELRELLNQMPDAMPIEAARTRLRLAPDAPPGVRGALLAQAVTDGEAGDDELADALGAVFAPGADVDHSVRWLSGLMRAAPDLLLHTPELLQAVDAAIGRLDEAAFLGFLPELRRSFSWLKPVETASLAEQVASWTGLSATDIVSATPGVTAADLARGSADERALLASVSDDQLTGWVGAP